MTILLSGSRDNRLLFKAALAADPDDAATAMRRWLDRVDLDAQTAASHRLIARAYARLSDRLTDRSEAPRLKAVTRQFWLRAQANIAAHESLFLALSEARLNWVMTGQAMWFLTRSPNVGEGADILDIHVQAPTQKVAATVQSLGWRLLRRRLSALRFPHQTFFVSDRSGTACRLNVHSGAGAVRGLAAVDNVRFIESGRATVPVPVVAALLMFTVRKWPLAGLPPPDLALDLANCLEHLEPEGLAGALPNRSLRARAAKAWLRSVGAFPERDRNLRVRGMLPATHQGPVA